MKWLLLLLCGCGASQLVVHVDTDAPVPPRPGSPPDAMRPPWLFDTLRVELLRDGTPVVDAREFSIDEGMFADRRVSFGIAPQYGDGDLILRLRLFRGDHALMGEPQPNATLDKSVALPRLSSSGGPVDVLVQLHVDDVGQPVAEEAAHGTIEHSQVGRWPGAKIVPCAAPAGAGEACIPGGAFWMGDPLLHGLDADQATDQERLVVLSPFYLGAHEVTNAEMRVGPTANINVLAPYPWEGERNPDVYDDWCTYTTGPSAADPDDKMAALPANCVKFEGARAYCQGFGGDLPSLAQLEFVASGRGEERSFPWGGDAPTCADAVWGWGGLGLQTVGFDPECRDSPEMRGAAPPGGGQRDRVSVPDLSGGAPVEILDLAGNLSEFVLDRWSRQDEPYWSRAGLFTDPVADQPSSEGDHLQAVHGGAWDDAPLNLRAAARRPVDIKGGVIFFNVGFRCARVGR